MGRSPLTINEIHWARKMWNLGYTYDDIGKVLHVSPKTIGSRVRATYGSADKKRCRPKLIYQEDK